MKKELQRGQREARWKEKVGEAAAYLSVTCGFGYSAVPMPAAGQMGGEEMGRLTVSGPRGAERGDEPREALWKCHCYFDSWTVFKKRHGWPFPPLWQDKEPGRQWGEPGLGSAPRGMFWLNKQLWTMVWKLSWTASLRGAFEICSTGSESKWKQEEKTSELQVSCEFEFLMPSLHFKDKRKVKFNITFIQMTWQASDLTETIWYLLPRVSWQLQQTGKFEWRWPRNLLRGKSSKPNIISWVCMNEHRVALFWVWIGRGEEVQKMLKVERQDLSWQPYCQHSIVQSNPHLNRKQCTRRKTGKTNKSKASERKKYIKNIPFGLDWLQERQENSTITQLKR